MLQSAPPRDRPPTLLESALGYDRTPAIVLLMLVPLACWIWIVMMARDMYGPMSGASAWMMTPVWDTRHVLLLWAMWAVMMAGMMLPSVGPMLLLYGAAARRQGDGTRATRQIYALAGGYLAVWAGFSVIATAIQRLLGSWLIVSPMMELTSPVAGAAMLLVAGVYQLTPLKLACLRTCQSPLGFLMRGWRPGVPGALRLGLHHGSYCVGCCWALMLLLFVGGVMNLAVIAALTAFVAFEKLGRFGALGPRVSGALLIAAAMWMLVR